MDESAEKLEPKKLSDSDVELIRKAISRVNELRHRFWSEHHELRMKFLAEFPIENYGGDAGWEEIWSLIIDMEDSLQTEATKRMQNRRSGGKYNSGLYPKEINNPEQMLLSETERKVHGALRSARDPRTGCTHIEAWRQEAGKQEISPRDFEKAMGSLLKKGHVTEDEKREGCYYSTLAAIHTKLCEVCGLPLQGREIKFCSKEKCKQVANSRRYREKNPNADHQAKLKYLKYITDCDE